MKSRDTKRLSSIENLLEQGQMHARRQRYWVSGILICLALPFLLVGCPLGIIVAWRGNVDLGPPHMYNAFAVTGSWLFLLSAWPKDKCLIALLAVALVFVISLDCAFYVLFVVGCVPTPPLP